MWEIESYLDRSLVMPDIIEFALSDKYLDRNLYPVQGTLLKINFLQDELFTQFDYDQIGAWTESFAITQDNGVQVDILERIRINKAEGRKWFREWVNPSGRRGSKGYIGAIAMSYVTWHLICKGDPQGYYGIDRDKRLALLVFSSKKEKAVAEQWGDINNMILGAPCFAPYHSKTPLKEDLILFAPHDFVRIQDREAIGMVPNVDSMATLQVSPKEATKISGRGPAVYAIAIDEMAHITRETARASAEEIYESATPALATFKLDAFLYEGSSPWQMIGQFYENSRQAILVSDGTDGFTQGTIRRPEILLTQLESWRTYEHWRDAHTIPLRPNQEDTFPAQRGAHQEYDEQLRRIEAANVDTFAVEYRAKWAAVLDAYLNPNAVDRMFEPWPSPLAPLNTGNPSVSLVAEYFCHSDPSKSGKNTSLVMAHLVHIHGDPLPHVVVDLVNHWEPAQFIDNEYQIDYREVLEDMKGVIRVFMPKEFTFDQGYSAWMIHELRRFVRANHFPKTVNVWERTATFQLNWAIAEVFKTALGLGLVHCYSGTKSTELLGLECKFLTQVAEKRVDHPTAGPVQTKDIYDALANLVYAFLGKHIASMMGKDLMALGVRGSQPGGFPLAGAMSQLGAGANFDSDTMGPQRPSVVEVTSRMKALHQQVRRMPPPIARGGRFFGGLPSGGRLPRRRR